MAANHVEIETQMRERNHIAIDETENTIMFENRRDFEKADGDEIYAMAPYSFQSKCAMLVLPPPSNKHQK